MACNRTPRTHTLTDRGHFIISSTGPIGRREIINRKLVGIIVHVHAQKILQLDDSLVETNSNESGFNRIFCFWDPVSIFTFDRNTTMYPDKFFVGKYERNFQSTIYYQSTKN